MALTAADKLKLHAEARDTGCLEITRGYIKGVVYLQDGILVHADYQGKLGMSALYDLVRMDDVVLNWHPGQRPVNASINVDLSSVLKDLQSPMIRNAVESGASLPDSAIAILEEQRKKETEAAVEQAKKTSSGLMERFCVQLVWTDAPGGPQTFRLEDKHQSSYLIGSSDDCQVRVDCPGVEPLHASLLINDEFVELWDLGTDNKTFHNGKVVHQAVLQSNDRLQFGQAEFQFEICLRRSAASLPEASRVQAPVPEGGLPEPVTKPRPKGPIRFETGKKAEAQNQLVSQLIGKIFRK